MAYWPPTRTISAVAGLLVTTSACVLYIYLDTDRLATNAVTASLYLSVMMLKHCIEAICTLMFRAFTTVTALYCAAQSARGLMTRGNSQHTV